MKEGQNEMEEEASSNMVTRSRQASPTPRLLEVRSVGLLRL